MKVKYLKTKKSIITLCLLFFGLLVSAQQSQISGTVLADDGQPLPGATVLNKESSKSVVTDFDGKFQINAKAGQTIIVSYIGYIENKFSTH